MKKIINIILYCFLFISKWFPEKNHWQPPNIKKITHLTNTWDVVVVLSDLHFFSHYSQPVVFEKIIKHECMALSKGKKIKFIILGDLFDSQKAKNKLTQDEMRVLELLEKQNALVMIGDHDDWLLRTNITNMDVCEKIILSTKIRTNKVVKIMLTHGDEYQKMQFSNSVLLETVVLPTYYSLKFFGHTLKMTWAKNVLQEIKKSAKIQAELLFAAKKAAREAKKHECKAAILAHFHTLFHKLFKIRKKQVRVLISDGSYDNPEFYIVIENRKIKRKKIPN